MVGDTDQRCSEFPLAFNSPAHTVDALQDDATSLPMLSVPHDVFRHGLGTLKDDIGHQHIVEAIQKNVRPTAVAHSSVIRCIACIEARSMLVVLGMIA